MSQDGNASRTIERAAAVLKAVGMLRRGPAGGARLTDVAEAVGLTKSTTHRILNSLVQVGFVDQDGDRGTFHLALGIYALGAAAAHRFHLSDFAHPAMLRLAERTGDTVYLLVRTGLESVCVERQEGAFPIKTLTLDVGPAGPLGLGAGNIAMLAFLPEEDVGEAIEASASSLAHYPDVDATVLLDLVQTTRQQGYSYIEELFIPGMTGIGVPILGLDGRPVAALSVAAITNRMQGDRRANTAAWLIAEARDLEARLGEITGGLTEGGLRRLAAKRRSRTSGRATGG